jgi:hypothetical protein
VPTALALVKLPAAAESLLTGVEACLVTHSQALNFRQQAGWAEKVLIPEDGECLELIEAISAC